MFFLNSLLLVFPFVLGGITLVVILKKKYLLFLRTPIDFGFKFRGKRIFGNNKTFLGFFVMTFVVVIFGTSTSNIYNELFDLNLTISSSLFSFAILGFAYPFGELPNSFLKRQIGITEGTKATTQPLRSIFTVVDLIDSYFLIGLVYIFVFGIRDFNLLLTSFLIGVLVHLAFDFLMYSMRLKRNE